MRFANELYWPASAVVTLVATCHIAYAGAPQQTVLQCVGDLWGEGINAPKDAVIPSRSHGVSGTFTIQGNELIQSGGGQVSDGHYTMCSTTPTTYVFSTDCTVQRDQYVHDWLNATDFNIESSPFFKKYQNRSWLSVETVIVDRVSLRVDEEQLTGHTGGIYYKKSGKAVYTPFLVSVRYLANCTLGTAKI